MEAKRDKSFYNDIRSKTIFDVVDVEENRDLLEIVLGYEITDESITEYRRLSEATPDTSWIDIWDYIQRFGVDDDIFVEEFKNEYKNEIAELHRQASICC